jgi:hypothetical protein
LISKPLMASWLSFKVPPGKPPSELFSNPALQVLVGCAGMDGRGRTAMRRFSAQRSGCGFIMSAGRKAFNLYPRRLCGHAPVAVCCPWGTDSPRRSSRQVSYTGMAEEEAVPGIVPNCIVFRHGLSHPVPMKVKKVRPNQVLSVSCPTCGVVAGQACLLHSGGLRTEPHVDRKFSAAEADKTKTESPS